MNDYEDCTCATEYDEHPCPFRIEINDDFETLCTCCAACEGDCAMEV